MKRNRTPTVIQMEAVECGAAALAIVLGHYGSFIPLEELRIKCGVTRDGSNALNIIKAAKNYGLQGRGVKCEVEDLKKQSLPLIVFWGFNHFLVVENFGKKYVYINDPASGPRRVTYAEFDENFTGVALIFETTAEFKKTKGPRKLWTLLYERLYDVKGPLLYLVLCGIGLLFPGLFLPAVNQVFFDHVFQGGYLNWIYPIFVIIFVLAAVSFLFTWLQTKFLNRLYLRLSATFSMAFFWHLLHLPLQFYAQRYHGEISFRLRLNAMSAKTLTSSLAPTIVNIGLIIFYATVMFAYDVVIAIIGVVAAIANLLILWIINRSRNDAYARMQQEQGKSIGFSLGALQNIETIKAAGNEGDFFSRWAGYNTKKSNAQTEIFTKDVILTSFPPLLQGLSLTALLTIGAWRIVHGDLTVGMLMALQALMTAFLLPINQLVGLGSILQTLKVDVDRLNDVIKNKIDPIYISESKNEMEVSKKLDGFLELKNVTFGYSPVDPPLIENFSFSLKPGQRIAFVGPTGSGKSTLAKLISGLYQPWDGQILYDGVPLGDLPRPVFTNSVGLVDQVVLLFAGTIRDNLTLWDKTITDEELMRASKDASIHDEILTRLGAYDAKVDENGRNFSGGQRQRMEIAKALVTNPRVLIMDEATSTLDSMTELQISQNIRKRGCTCVMVAHRLSTIRDCDEIIVLSRGKIVQRGKHDELKKEEGIYQDLVIKEQVG